MSSRWAPAVMLAPACVLLLVLFVVPEVTMIRLSFGPSGVSLAEYARFLGDALYLRVLLRSLWLGGLVTAVTVLLGVPLSYWLARIAPRWSAILLLLTTFPLWISAVVRAFGWVELLGRAGVISRAVRATGLVGPGFALTGSFSGAVIALAQVLLPYAVLSLFGVMRTIDPEIERAAQNLGASPFVAAVTTTIRLAARGILSTALLIFALAISAFAVPSLVGGARVQLMATTIYEQMTELADWPFAAAISVVLLVVVLALAVVWSWLTPAETVPGR